MAAIITTGSSQPIVTITPTSTSNSSAFPTLSADRTSSSITISTSITSASTTSSTSTIATSAPIPSGSNSNDSAPPSGLSTAAKAGTAIGAFLIILIGTFIVLFCIRHRRRKRDSNSYSRPDDSTFLPYEKGVDISNSHAKPELHGFFAAATQQGGTDTLHGKPELAAETYPTSPQNGSRTENAHLLSTEMSTQSDSSRSQQGHMHNHSSRNNGNNELATDSTAPPPPDEININVLKAQERELAHRMKSTKKYKD
ncbi:hypothetical protein LTR05_006928 [Lithohypha guttulata]|uniref:Uncharacterized protein n=1 Tax=Lithohypha guttulata TaxID=1690604 RepID=A0AAN7SWR2_9EURO|nr:hypothetical protein LTR05_006928 [Lithohypha guttulata]